MWEKRQFEYIENAIVLNHGQNKRKCMMIIAKKKIGEKFGIYKYK